MKHRNLFISALLTSILFVGCTQSPTTETNKENNQPAPSKTQTVEQKSVSNVYDMNATVGKQYGEMTLTKITPALEKREIADNNLHAEFAGNVTISGLYEYINNDEGMFIGKGEVCFTVKDGDSVQKLPVAKFDTTVNEKPEKFFCFSNNEKAQKLLGKTQGEVTITINSYTDDTFEGEALDRASLESVQK